MNDKYTYAKINNLSNNMADFLCDCSEAYHKKVDVVAEKVFSHAGKKVVMLAGPSSSGKTTTASILSEDIEKLGGKAYTVSLDDFYLNNLLQTSKF